MRCFAFLMMSCAVAVASLAAEREEVTINVPYEIQSGGSSIVYIGNVEYSVRGVTLNYVEYTYAEAVKDYAEAYQVLIESLAGNNNLTATIRTQAAANWAASVEQQLRLAGNDQRIKDTQYTQALYNELVESGETMEDAKARFDQERTRLDGLAESLQTTFNTASQNISAEMKLLAASATAIAEAAKGDLADVVKKVKDLSEKAERTETELSELKSLKAKMTEYATIKRAGEIAAQKAQEAIARLSIPRVPDMTKYELVAISSNNWNRLSKFLGRKTGKSGDETKDETHGIFVSPWQLLEANEGCSYAVGEGDTIITMLDDAGYAPILSEDELARWKDLANRDRPARYFRYGDDGNGRPTMTAEPLHGGDDHVSFPAPSNWVDGQTIVWSNGVYKAVGGGGGGRMADTELVPKNQGMTQTIDVETDKITTNEYFAVHGFSGARVGSIAYKKSGTELGWKVEQGAGYRFVGTDKTEHIIPGAGTTNTVTFASATNANVTVSIESDKAAPNAVTIRIGVYYL